MQQRSTVGASGPTNFVHEVHVGFDPNTGAFTVSYETHMTWIV